MGPREDQHEREPLLERIEDIAHADHPIIPQARSPRTMIAIIISITFVLNLAGMLMALPEMRIYEDIICHRHYERLQGPGHIGLTSKIDESLCKGDDIQNELNIIIAGKSFLSAIPGMFVAIPFGLLADKIGRKPVLAIVVTGYCVSYLWDIMITWFWRTFPLRLVWLQPLFILIGGGDGTAATILFAIISDITIPSNRANTFLLVGCTSQVAAIIGPSIAAALMVHSPWNAFFLGYSLLILGSMSVMFVPETLHLHSTKDSTLAPDTGRTASPSRADELVKSLRFNIHAGMQRLRDSASIVSIPILILLLTFISQPFSTQAVDMFSRYISRRFSWPLAKTGYLLSFRGFINIALLLGIIPGVSHILMRRLHYSSWQKDLALAKVSALLLTVGVLVVAFSPTVPLTVIGYVIWTCGSGFTALCRSLLTMMVEKQHIARMYSAITVLETGGDLLAGPTIGALFALGIKWKGAYIGLPYFGMAITYLLTSAGIYLFGFMTKEIEIHDYQTEPQPETEALVDEETGH